ncbi:MAG TPA: J domain-containing protein [Ktedonobacteraceae bacterium]|nr:J domain-containing protein [Ktedonobacteraceae bacterium]
MRNQPEVELMSLKKVSSDRWEFCVKPHSSFVQIFLHLAEKGIFAAGYVVATGKYRPDYRINDEGMWLLSHCFSNWEEMFQKATQKSPWEEQWQKKTEEQAEKHHSTYAFRQEYGSFTGNPSAQSGPTIDELRELLRWMREGTSFFSGDPFRMGHFWTDSNQKPPEQPSFESPTTYPEAMRILGLSSLGRDATQEEVKKAFRQKAKTTHPDAGGSEAAFVQLNAAYQLALKFSR